MKKLLSVFLILLLAVTLVYAAVTWTERQPGGDSNQFWACCASDADGSSLIAGVDWGGRLYTSSNSGVDWTQRQPAGDFDKYWRGVDCDEDGSCFIACVNDGRLRIMGLTGLNAGLMVLIWAMIGRQSAQTAMAVI